MDSRWSLTHVFPESAPVKTGGRLCESGGGNDRKENEVD